MYKVRKCTTEKSLNSYEVYYENKKSTIIVCEIPRYHQDDKVIATLIALLLNNKKYKLDLLKEMNEK